jgi:hypothetical protein
MSTSVRAISTRHEVDTTQMTPSTVGTAKAVSPADFRYFPRSSTLVLVRRLTAAEITNLSELLLDAPRDTAFRVQAERFIERVQRFHDETPSGEPDIYEQLGLGLDQIQELADDPQLAVADPWLRKVSWAFTDWNNPLTPDQRRILEGDGTDPGWITIAPNGSTLQSLVRALGKRVFTFDKTQPHAADPVSGDPLFGRAKVDTSGTEGQLIWTQGPASAAELTALQAWASDTSFSASFRQAVSDILSLLTTLESVQLGYDPGDNVPTIGPGHPLFGRLVLDSTADAGSATWKLGSIDAAERTALEDLADASSGADLSFHAAMGRLLFITDKFVVQVPVEEGDFAARPQPADFAAAGLAGKADFLRGVMRVDGLMLRREEEFLEKICHMEIDRNIMRRLYNDSLRTGFENAELQIMASRGNAAGQTAAIEPYL